MTPSVRTRSLRYRYPEGFEVGPVDLEVGPGLLHLQGANGSGKSTLLRLLCGALRPTAGQVEVNGGDPRDARVRSQVALLAPEPEVPGFLTAHEAWHTLAALRGCPDWDGSPWLEALGLEGGLVLRHGSAGQRRKAEWVAALAGDPQVLLLDEPLAHLDAAACQIVAQWLEAWRAERVVVVASHEALPVVADAVVQVRAGEQVCYRAG